jgi:hypothetical protein
LWRQTAKYTCKDIQNKSGFPFREYRGYLVVPVYLVQLSLAVKLPDVTQGTVLRTSPIRPNRAKTEQTYSPSPAKNRTRPINHPHPPNSLLVTLDGPAICATMFPVPYLTLQHPDKTKPELAVPSRPVQSRPIPSSPVQSSRVQEGNACRTPTSLP